MSGMMIKATPSMQPTMVTTRRPYCSKTLRPLVETASKTRPKMPKGANSIIHVTTLEMLWVKSFNRCLVDVEAKFFKAKPKMIDQNKMLI